MEAGLAVDDSSAETVAVRTEFVTGAAGAGDPGAVPTGEAAGLGGVAGLGGAGLSGLMPPSQAGPEYISDVRPFVFHFSS